MRAGHDTHWSPMAMAAASSEVQIVAVRPNGESFMSLIASSSDLTCPMRTRHKVVSIWPEGGPRAGGVTTPTFMMPMTGPKLSSTMTAIEWSTLTSTCGAMYGVPG